MRLPLAAILDVIRGEGIASAMRRAGERIEEALSPQRTPRAEIVNVSATSVAPRTGGVAIQLQARLRAERALREVALVQTRDVRRAIAITGARALHLEGTLDAPIGDLLSLEVPVILSVHDFTLWDAPLAGPLLESAAAVIFPSRFLHDRYREHFAFRGEIIEPAVPVVETHGEGERRGVAFAGSVKELKGARLLPGIARRLSTDLHVFGGGDVDLFRPLRKIPNVVIHGYYRSGTLPSLLARHHIGVVLLPSIVEESYSLTLSEAWLAGCAAAAFDLGAPAERIRSEGGGWLAPLDSGAEGLVAIVDRWRNGARVEIPRVTSTPEVAARKHVELYRKLGLLHSSAPSSS